MNQKDLESFVSVVEAGSFSQAALLLRKPQPALSRHVRDLETELRIRLLYRNGRGVITTEAGQRLYHRATAILEQITAARAEAISAAGGGPERVTIGLPPSLARLLSLPLARSLRAAHPCLKLNLAEAMNGHLLEFLAAGAVDIAVLYATEAAQRLHADSLFEEPLCLVSGVDLPGEIAARELRDIALILPTRQHGLRRQVDLWATRHGVEVSVAIECDALSATLQLVAGEVGCTLLPESAIRGELERGDLVSARIIGPPLRRTMVLATPTNRPMPTGLGELARIVKRTIREFFPGAGTPPIAGAPVRRIEAPSRHATL